MTTAIGATAKLSELVLPHGRLQLPAFLPDATRAVVRSIDSVDLEQVGVQAVVMNAFHLMQKPGSSTVKALGGLHKMSGWRGPIMTDSGGFQAYSLIRQNSKYGSISDKGIVIRPENGGHKILLSPEKCVQLQLAFGADIVVCLDDCTDVGEDETVQREAVRRTVAWAKRCKAEFNGLLASRGKKQADDARPLLFGVIQGGGSKPLRKECAEALLEIGFDGFGFGGWPLDKDGSLLEEIVGYTRELVPRTWPMHALGIGHPKNVVATARLGYPLFDCALPTRDARHGRLYLFKQPPAQADLGSDWFTRIYVADDKFVKDDRPLSEFCDCPTCQRYSRGYLYHLYHIKDSSFMRLATLHNLRFMAQLIDRIRVSL